MDGYQYGETCYADLVSFRQPKHETKSVLQRTDYVQQMHLLDYNQQQTTASWIFEIINEIIIIYNKITVN